MTDTPIKGESSQLELSRYTFETIRQDGEFIVSRGRLRPQADGGPPAILTMTPTSERPALASLRRMDHEFSFNGELDPEWAARPLALASHGGRTTLVFADPGGDPLDRLLGEPMELTQFLRLAIGLSAALGQAHGRGLVHKDLKPANILVNCVSGEARLTGFGIASRLPRERLAPAPPESIAGTLAYMAPEQTGRMNRSIDSRSDLYALGVTLYQMLTGSLPFAASEPMEWVHCHIARKPVPPSERLEKIPVPVSQIIMKLLSKTAEERYQTAAGVENDLRRCLAEWERHGRIDPFALGERDTPDRLRIPEKLYGRAREVDALLASLDRVVKNGTPELVLVSGYSGIGKSSVVRELHKMLVPPRGLFASGKLDQYRRDIPYATLAQIFQKLMRPLLGKSDAELASCRDMLWEALGPSGALLFDLVPELKLVVGERPSAPELPSQDAQGRFHLVCRRFMNIFARPEHPLALFLDDLQWLDAATLDFIEDLFIQRDVQHLLLIGAYRNNEVDSSHPLMRKVDAIREAGAMVQEITLAPLAGDDVGQFIADALHCQQEDVASLAQLMNEKTAGNPYFLIQFLNTLADERMLTFEHGRGSWSWDLRRIRAKEFTANVVDLLVGRLNRLPSQALRTLQEFACLGNAADISTLSIVRGTSEDEVHSDLWEGIRLELIVRLEHGYRFAHDRVQEAAYSLIPEPSRAQTHLRIGNLLRAHALSEEHPETLFDTVNHLNRGAGLITVADERERLAALNLMAGKRAKARTAYESALTYLGAGRGLLGEAGWKQNYKLTFELELLWAECETLTGALTSAENRLLALAEHAANQIDRAAATRACISLYITLDRLDSAIGAGLKYLGHAGIEWPSRPEPEDVSRELERMWQLLGGRTVEQLLDLPLMNDASCRATMDVLCEMLPPAGFFAPNLLELILLRMVNLSLENGHCDASCFAYCSMNAVFGFHLNDYQMGYRFGRLSYDLVEKCGLDGFKARTLMHFGAMAVPWVRHLPSGQPMLRRALDMALKTGDLHVAICCGSHLTTNLLDSGEFLANVEHEIEMHVDFLRRSKSEIDTIIGQRALVRALRGLTAQFGSFDDEAFEERHFEQRLEQIPWGGTAVCRYWIQKMQARFMAGDYVVAVQAGSKARKLIWSWPSFFEEVDYYFFYALALAQVYDTASTGERTEILEVIVAHRDKLATWAGNCPENFENRAALVGAEIARIEGRMLEAEQLYEQAIRSAHDRGFVNNEAIAYEIAAQFYAARGFETIADAYLRRARYAYVRWGADGKVRQLDARYRGLRTEETAPAATSTMASSVEQLDLATVIKVSQAVSGEIVQEKLLETLMRTALEQAGAERGLLILSREAEQRIAAEATTRGDAVIVDLRNEPVGADVLPESVFHYVLRTRDSVVLDEASQSAFAADPYIIRRHARSVLCLPLLNQAKVIGVLFLENNLAPRVFAPARLAVLKLLASQAAISLENSRLYRDLTGREARFRRLVEANIIGIVIWDLDGRLLEANDAFLRMVQYEREDLQDGLRWFDMTPPEWQEVHMAEEAEELKATGAMKAREKEYFRKDGSRVPVLIGAAAFDGQPTQGVAYILDLTERKRAEAAARENEQRYREVQMELAHANRVATMGQLAGSIAHEVSQPIAATVIGAKAALGWLEREPPDVERARRSLDRIIKDGARAGEVFGRTREFIKKSPPRQDRLEINGPIGEVIELTRGEATKNQVFVKTDFAQGLPYIRGDRVQLQQVMLNLIINAVEAMSGVDDGRRELAISTGKSEVGDVIVIVRDSGPGLASVADGRVFDAFYTTKTTGLGMGLSICRSIIEAHGGRLWASANEPRGARFQFTLPPWEEAAAGGQLDRTPEG